MVTAKHNDDIYKKLYLATLSSIEVISQSLEGGKYALTTTASGIALLRGNIDDLVWYCTVNHSLTLKKDNKCISVEYQ